MVSKLLCSLLSLSLFAFVPLHHGWSSYDQTKPTNVTGKILEMTYENPHSVIKLEEKKRNGRSYLLRLPGWKAAG